MRTLTLAKLFVQLLGFYAIFQGLSIVFVPILSAIAATLAPGDPQTGWDLFGFAFFMSAAPALLGCVLVARASWIARKICGAADEPIEALGYTPHAFESLCFALLGLYILINEAPAFVRFLSWSFIRLGREAATDATPQLVELVAHATTISLGVLLFMRAKRLSSLLQRLRQ